nr:MAG TPA: major capsid protein [Caudoviricetes sp.]
MNRLAEIRKRKAEIRSILQDDTQQNIDLDALEKELRALNEEEVALERRQDMANNINTGETTATVIEAPQAPVRRAENPYDSAEYRTAFMRYVTRNEPIPAEFRSDDNTMTDDIGALVPPVTLNKIVEKIEAYGMILPLVTRTAYKTGMTIPVASVKPVASWVAEGKGSDKQKENLDASITFGHFKLRCAVSVTLEVENMALSAFEARLVSSISEAMAKAIEKAILTGTGTGQPTGILKDTTKGASIAVKAIDYKTLVSAEAALPMEYENGAVWVMSKKTFMEFVGMTDTNGQPIARVNYGIGGVPDRTLLGRRVVLTNYLPAYASTLKTADVFAFLYDFSDYTLNTNFEVGMKVYEDNDTDDIVRKSIMVCDGKPILSASLVKLTGSAE